MFNLISQVSPIEYGHVLLIPKILERFPQRIGSSSFLLAQHGCAYYLSVPFPIEKAPTQKITINGGGMKISKLLNYPVRGLVFESGNSIEDLSIVVSDSSISLQENNIPYNVLIADSGKRIFLLPQYLAVNLGVSTGKKQNIVALSSTIVGGENP
ncbi:hypothetical protein IFM89_033361 [Coptis chinensis]|uniref:GDPGP1-like C-terminal domain-containing protein n=1 Tax=Coptis chinensis TaxID=261450 RepID=A0A835HHA3_9MAGN|nr:hypothetical protein IFM89_033361 [Coptis chinensis]